MKSEFCKNIHCRREIVLDHAGDMHAWQLAGVCEDCLARYNFGESGETSETLLDIPVHAEAVDADTRPVPPYQTDATRGGKIE